ncbi:PAS domain-containing protein [Emticicia sp. 17c]|uniref:PAS domain-containing protein n=1 Tax=Emticicia sp. 17c TaxID=3127704 RepID=UPI00301C3097
MIKKFATISLEKTNMSSNLKGAFGRFTQKIYPKQLQPQQIIEQFYLLLEYTEEAFWVIDTNLNILIFNNKFYERYLTYFNISLEIGRSVLDFIEPENIGRIKGLYSRVFNGETFETETPRKAENGEMHTFLNRFKPYYDPQGNIIGAFVSTIDITDTKRTQICLQKIEDKYRSVIENSHHAFLYSKTDGTILSTNHRASEIFGYSIEEFRQVNLKQIINPQGVNYEKVVEQIKQNNKIEGELLGIRKNGESFPFEFTSTIYEDINGEKRVCTFLTDITERKLIEKAVEKSEKRFRALVENAVDIIILTNNEGKVLYVSPAYEKITGFSLLEVIGKDGKYLLPIEGVEMGIQVLQKLLQNPGVAIPRTTRLITKENKLIWVEGVVTNFLHDENVCAIVANFRDITDKKTAEEKLEQSERNLKAIFENTAEGFVLLDTEFNVKVFNSKAKELALFDSETKLELNKSIFELVPEHIKEVKKDYFTRVLRGENMQFDRLYQHENQEDVWLTYSLRQVTEDGVCKGICITVKDISERKKAEKELINKEYRFRSLIEHSQDMVTLINLNGYVEYISPSVERILGYKTEEVATIHITEVIHPDDLELFSDKFKILFEQTDSQIHATLRCMNKNGKYVWVEGNASNMLDIEGVEAIVINFRDITERKNFEDQQKLLASIIDYSEDAILSTDLNGVISSWNRGAESTYGYSSQEMLGSNIFRIVPPIKQAEELEIIEKIKEGLPLKTTKPCV